MKLIVGLGNPGSKYNQTRHNVGFDVVDKLSVSFGLGKPKSKFQGEVIDASIDGEHVLLFRPMTYMNLSGQAAQLAVAFYKLSLDQLLVICDDINLPLAKLRFRSGGSSGGQKGLANMIDRLGSNQFGRLRIGIGAPPAIMEARDYVLSRFLAEEKECLEKTLNRAVEAVADWVREGIDYCMNHYNGQ